MTIANVALMFRDVTDQAIRSDGKSGDIKSLRHDRPS